MARVDIELNGRFFPVMCEDGQESRLREVVTFVDTRMRGLAMGNSHASDSQVYVLTMLTMADQLFDLRSDLLKMRTAAQLAEQKAQRLAAEEASASASEGVEGDVVSSEGDAKARRKKGRKGRGDDAASDGGETVAATGNASDSPVETRVVTETVVVKELDPEVEERYARIIESLVERVDAVASRLARV